MSSKYQFFDRFLDWKNAKIVGVGNTKSHSLDIAVATYKGRFAISCQDVNFREIKDMKKRAKHFVGMPEFT